MKKLDIQYISTVAQIEILKLLLEVDKRGTIEKLLEHLESKEEMFRTLYDASHSDTRSAPKHH